MTKLFTAFSIAIFAISASAEQDDRARDSNKMAPLEKMMMTCPETKDLKFELPETRPTITISDTAFKVWGGVLTLKGEFEPALGDPVVKLVMKDGVLNMECTYSLSTPIFESQDTIELYTPLTNYKRGQCKVDQDNFSVTCK